MKDRALGSGRSVVKPEENIALAHVITGTDGNIFDDTAITVLDHAQVAIDGNLATDNDRADQIGIRSPAEHGGDQKPGHENTRDDTTANGINRVLCSVRVCYLA